MDPRLRHQGDDEQRFSVLAEKVLMLDGWGVAAVLLIRYIVKCHIKGDNTVKMPNKRCPKGSAKSDLLTVESYFLSVLV